TLVDDGIRSLARLLRRERCGESDDSRDEDVLHGRILRHCFAHVASVIGLCIGGSRLGPDVTTLAAPDPGGGSRTITRVPWYRWCAALAVTSAYVGGYWDISWHRSIGRDSFWTPAHLAIYACGVLAGISSAHLILTTTFGRDRSLRAVSVRVWGLRAPAGA